jgi:uncharacterized membrane protein
MKRLRTAFFAGFLVLVPVLATVDILRWFVRTVDGSVRQYLPTHLLPFDFSGLGLVLALLVVLAVGILTTNFIGRLVISRFDKFVKRFPLIGGLYGVIKKFLETILDSKQDRFNEAVLVEFPSKGMYSVGFRTGDPDPKLVKGVRKKLVQVFIPMTPNPTSGYFLLVPKADLIPLKMTVQEAFKIVVSMGVVSTEVEEKLVKKLTKK